MSKIYVSEEEYKVLQKDIEQLKNKLNNCIVKEWYKTDDLLKISSHGVFTDRELSIRSNYDTWESTLGTDQTKNILYINIENKDYSSKSTFESIGLTLDQMKKISDYLLHKINYIEGRKANELV